MRPLPPPRFATAGYERVGFALLIAATPPRVAPEYNKRRGELWGRCQSRRTLPSPDEFEAHTAALRDLLRVAPAPPRGVCDEGTYAELVRAARRLDAEMPRRADSPYVFTTRTGKRFSKTSHYYYWHAVRSACGRPGMDFYELRHFCATELLRLGVSHADVAVQLGHTDGRALVMSTYGHPSEDEARERLRRAYTPDVRRLRAAE